MVSFNRILRCVAIATSFVAVTNCSESATSPTSATSLTPSFNRGGSQGSSGHNDHFKAGDGYVTYKIDGTHELYISRNAICDLGTSLYGPGTWNLPCQSSNKDVDINAKTTTTSNGHPRIDFDPPMRFNPDAQDVILVIHDPVAASNPKSAIMYCNDLGVCVDEGKSDKALITHHDSERGIVWRKIRHFSGYVTSSGDPCDPTTSTDPTCQYSDNSSN
jgi:hypothetical protein